MKNINKILINKSFQKLQKVFGTTMVVLTLLSLESCGDTYLDVVPDNIATIDNAFTLKNEAEKYLFTCYSYLPKNGDAVFNIGMLAGNEAWIPPLDAAIHSDAHQIAKGEQNKVNPLMDAWEGRYQGAGPGDGYRLFNGIRHCNVFLENVSDYNKVPDLSESLRLRWIAEVKFLKAYYHYYLMRMYGPIPVIRENLPLDADNDVLQVAREPIDSTVDYIVSLLDEAIPNLPPVITNKDDEFGRITRPAALGIKAEVLLTAASPLFNGNEDMIGFTAKDGTPLFNTVFDASKWQKAADAAKEAIDVAEINGHMLFTQEIPFSVSSKTRTKMDVRGAVTEPWNEEVIWANPNSRTYELQRLCMANLSIDVLGWQARKVYAPTLKSAMNFYTKNGVPIEEDKSIGSQFNDITQLKTGTEAEKLEIIEGYKTSILNYNREPRFYADLGFDGSVYYGYSSGADETKYKFRAKYADYAGSSSPFDYNVTGYFCLKLVNWEAAFENGGVSYKEYAWPELRLADLYLMYAEALNEADGSQDDVLEYVDKVRERAGLNGVVRSWNDYSTNGTKYSTKNGRRDIIRRERSIEMAYEGKNYWDIRRWKTASTEFNQAVRGWNYTGLNDASYYQIRTLFQQQFVAPRDYFWPINELTLIQNPNLVQNPGW